MEQKMREERERERFSIFLAHSPTIYSSPCWARSQDLHVDLPGGWQGPRDYTHHGLGWSPMTRTASIPHAPPPLPTLTALRGVREHRNQVMSQSQLGMEEDSASTPCQWGSSPACFTICVAGAKLARLCHAWAATHTPASPTLEPAPGRWVPTAPECPRQLPSPFVCSAALRACFGSGWMSQLLKASSLHTHLLTLLSKQLGPPCLASPSLP